MKTKFAALLSILLLILSWSTQSESKADVPEEFANVIPTELKGNLKLVEVKNRCVDCEPWRYIYYYSNESNEPIKKEKVSVQAGYRAMYAYPGTEYFSNTKIEKSISGNYPQDKATVIDAITHEFNRKKERVKGYLEQTPGLREKMEPFKAKGKDHLSFEHETINGYEYVSYTENVIGLLGKTISQIHIFVPEQEIIITAYLLSQKKQKFKDIEEFLELRHDFIESYTKYIKENRLQKGRIEQESQWKYVLDSANLFTRKQSSEINALISDHNRFGFGHIRLIVIQQLPENTTIEDYAYAVLRDDLTSAEGRLDRVLLVVALTNRKLRIEVSTAVWPILSDEFCQQVIDNHIIPQFKQENYFIGIRDGLRALIAKLSNKIEL